MKFLSKTFAMILMIQSFGVFASDMTCQDSEALKTMKLLRSVASTVGCDEAQKLTPEQLVKEYDLSLKLTSDLIIPVGDTSAPIYFESKGEGSYLEYVSLDAKEVSYSANRKIPKGTVLNIDSSYVPSVLEEKNITVVRFGLKNSNHLRSITLSMQQNLGDMWGGFDPILDLLDKGSMTFQCSPRKVETIDID